MRIDKDNIKIFLILLIIGLGIGYAYINSDLNINGTAQVNHANWDVHWANIQVTNGSVSGTNVVTAPSISNSTTASYSIILNTPGDYYEFTVDAVNGGSIDAMIDTIDSKLNGATITTLPDYLKYTVTYSDGVALEPNHQLLHNTIEKYKVRIEYNADIELNQIPATNQTLELQFTVTYRQATDDAIAVDHSFNGHSWETIINNVRSGNTDIYNIGDIKTVDLGTFGTHTLRIANMSTPAECSQEGFSQTACGFVLEFADVITEREMNSTDTNVGGWPASSVYTYVNSDIYNALPEQLKNGITSTEVVSGHGTGESNFTSTDKLYLLDVKEIYGESFKSSINTSKDYERQLDYYNNAGVTTSNYSGAIKQYNGSNVRWWMRSAHPGYTNTFYYVYNNGYLSNGSVRNTSGVSPAFRIG